MPAKNPRRTRPDRIRPDRIRPIRLVLLILLALLFAAPLPLMAEGAVDSADVWPQWRGPERTGAVPTTGPEWPSDLKGLEPVWRVETLGPSYSGPIVGEKRIFTTETHEEKYEVVHAFDRATGEKLWSKQWGGAMKVPFFAARNGSWIRATPAYDGDTLYVGGILEVVVALDAETGAERWRLDFPEKFGGTKPPFGFVCSPMIDGDDLYVEAAGSLFKLNKKTGEIIWRSETWGGDMMSDGTFSSPVIAELGGERQVLVQTRQELRGLDPKTGAVLWSQHVPSFRGMNILTPVVWNDKIFTSTYRNASYLFGIEGAEAGWSVQQLWTNEAQAYMSSPVIIGDVAYTHLGNGRLTAIQLADGERLWTSKPMGAYWSMAYRGDKILALNDEGEMLLIEASPEEFKLLDQREVSKAETWAHVAVAGDHVVVRELDGLSIWRWSEAAASPEVAADSAEAAPSAP